MEKRVGKIIAGTGGLFTVLCDDGEAVACRARGIFRHDEIKPTVGDRVSVGAEQTIDDVLPRRNLLIRPPVSNLDYMFVTVATRRPETALTTTDKLISICEYNSIEPVIVITKSDLDEERAALLSEIYESCGFSCLSGNREELRDKVYEYIRSNVTGDKSAAFAGASGVGKSTLLNSVFPSLQLGVGEVSRKISRGRHTTREVSLFYLPLTETGADGGYIADTPGFSMLDFGRFDFFPLESLVSTFREFEKYTPDCRWADCTHTKESDCAVLGAVKRGEIPESRHKSYLEMYSVLHEKHDWDK